MPISSVERDNRLNRFRGTATPAVPASHYISLHSADPGLTGASELTGNAYARMAVSSAVGSWGAPATNGAVRQITNTNLISFPAATPAAWSAATHFGVWDAATAGNFIRGNVLDAPKTAGIGDNIKFDPGALILNEQ